MTDDEPQQVPSGENQPDEPRPSNAWIWIILVLLVLIVAFFLLGGNSLFEKVVGHSLSVEIGPNG